MMSPQIFPKLLMFASGEVGLRIVELTAARGPVSVVVYDKKDDPETLERIQSLTPDAIHVESGKLESSLPRLSDMQLDLGILAWWPYILRGPILDVPRLGHLNCHPSYLPFSRGRHYYFWNLVEESPSGATIHFVDSEVDHGDICFQEVFDTDWEDNAFTLVDKSRQAVIDLYSRNIEQILSLDLPRTTNPVDKGTLHRSSEIAAASKIDLDREYSARQLLNILRGCSGFPGNWASFDDAGTVYEVSVSIRKKSRGI